MTSPILLCTDGSELSVAAVKSGIELLGADSEFELVSVADSPEAAALVGSGHADAITSRDQFEILNAAAIEAAETTLTEAAEQLGLPDAPHRVLHGDAGTAICDHAGDVEATAIVLGSRGRSGLKRAVMGSVSDHVVRHAPCPVVVSAPSAIHDDESESD